VGETGVKWRGGEKTDRKGRVSKRNDRPSHRKRGGLRIREKNGCREFSPNITGRVPERRDPSSKGRENWVSRVPRMGEKKHEAGTVPVARVGGRRRRGGTVSEGGVKIVEGTRFRLYR